MEKIIIKVKAFIKSEKLLYALCSLLFAAAFAFKRNFGDDLVQTELFRNKTILDIWNYDFGRYFTWSSRVLINFFANCLIVSPKILWQLAMGAAMFILMSSMAVIFNVKHKNGALYICFITMLLPWQIYNSAGWIATSASYFIPVAVGVMGFIPIAKAYRGEPSSVPEKILCAAAMIFAANIEQFMAVALGIYLVADIYFIAVKKLRPIMVVQFIICAASAAYTFLCPGNAMRSNLETARWFPSYPMFGTVDKSDIGLFSTLNSLFVSDIKLLTIAVSLLITVIGFKKYNDVFYRVIFALPTVLLILFGPLYGIMSSVFPHINKDHAAVSANGLMTVENVDSIIPLFGFLLMLGMLMLIFVCIILISSDILQLASSAVILGAGLMSRAAIGFSPTIYASGPRTFSVLYMCMLVFAVKIYSENISEKDCSECKSSAVSTIMYLFIIFSFADLLLIG